MFSKFLVQLARTTSAMSNDLELNLTFFNIAAVKLKHSLSVKSNHRHIHA